MGILDGDVGRNLSLEVWLWADDMCFDVDECVDRTMTQYSRVAASEGASESELQLERVVATRAKELFRSRTH